MRRHLMLTAHDFRYIYENGKLPDLKQLTIPNEKKEEKNKDSIIEEWHRIDITLTRIAQSLLKSNNKKKYPPCFCINIKHIENIRRLQTELFFKTKRLPCPFIFDGYSYCLEF